MTDPLKTAIKANGTNGQSIIDYFVGIKGDCNKKNWSAMVVNMVNGEVNYWLLDANLNLDYCNFIPQGYTLIDEI